MEKQGNVDEWRGDLLARASDYTQDGFDTIQWISAQDEHTCPKCAARHGKKYTQTTLREELEGQFCVPGDPGDRCRCVIVVAFD